MNTKSTPLLRAGARVVLAWCTLVWPVQWHVAYAQTLPQTQEQTPIDIRADRLSRGWGREVQSAPRSPSFGPSTAPIRGPRIIPGSSDAALADRAAQNYPPRPISETVESAQRGQNIGLEVYDTMDLSGYSVSFQREDPVEGGSDPRHINVPGIFQTYTSTARQEVEAFGSRHVNNPSGMKQESLANQAKMRRIGCRKTDMRALEAQNPLLAHTGAEHRILKIEFFDYEYHPIPATNPVEYELVRVPGVHRGGMVRLEYPTIGTSANVWWEHFSDAHGMRITHVPFNVPHGVQYFTYNTQLAFDMGGGPQIQSNATTSFGSAADSWTPRFNVTVPAGARAVYVSTDLYQTDVTYTPAPEDGTPCEPDPPTVCEVPVVNRAGQTIRWCPGEPGANVRDLYDDIRFGQREVSSKQLLESAVTNMETRNYEGSAALRSGVTRGLNSASNSKVQELIGVCRRQDLGEVILRDPYSYHVPELESCAATLVDPYPDGCKPMQRSFGLARIGEHRFLTIKAYERISQPVIDPQTGAVVGETFIKEPIPITGSVNIDFPAMGVDNCPRIVDGINECAPEPEGEGVYFEYTHTPFGGNVREHAVNEIRVAVGGNGTFSDYGSADDMWLPAGTVHADGSSYELGVTADIYMVTINTFGGCEQYMNMVADGFCRGGQLTCTETSTERTVGGVTFGPGLPNRGIVDLLAPWGTDYFAQNPDYQEGADVTSIIGEGLVLIEDRMCWVAEAEPFESCAVMEVSDDMRTYTEGVATWATDCNLMPSPFGTSLEDAAQAGQCRRAPSYDSCEESFRGAFSDTCYLKQLAYDCGVEEEGSIPNPIGEYADVCTGSMRCIGTQCHRPNLTGYSQADFAAVVGAGEALNMMKYDMVCAETGEPPTSTTQTCTPTVFGGTNMYCKIPIGTSIGITPHCCNEAREAVSGERPNWIDYMKIVVYGSRILNNESIQTWLSSSELYNSVSSLFGEVSSPFADALAKGSSFVNEIMVKPFQAGFDGFFSSPGAAGGSASSIGVDSAAKAEMLNKPSMGMGNPLEFIADFKQLLMQQINQFLIDNGMEQLAQMLFTENVSGELTAGPLLAAVQVYMFIRLIGHIIFACKTEEYEWAMANKQRLCSYVGSCCSSRTLGVCLERRRLYCCYKTMVARIISEQIITKGLSPSRPNGYERRRCRYNCSGFTPMELALVDWAQVDLTEWIDALIESGIYNMEDPIERYGTAGTGYIDSVKLLSGEADVSGEYDHRVPAEKTVELMTENFGEIGELNQATRSVAEHCYNDEDARMPFVTDQSTCEPED